MLMWCFTEVDKELKRNLITEHIENRSKEKKRFAKGYRANDWNTTWGYLHDYIQSLGPTFIFHFFPKLNRVGFDCK